MDTSKHLEQLLNLICMHAVSRSIYVLADAGVADLLGSEPRTVADLAAETELDCDALQRILRLLSGYGLFVAEGAGYMHTPLSELLRSDHPRSLRAFAQMMGMPALWNGITGLPQAVRSGTPESNWSDLVDHFSEHPQEARLFNEAMTSKSWAAIEAAEKAYDFSVFETIADIGGGRGHLLQEICAGHPVAGILFDLPHVIADAAAMATPQLQLVEGDFFRDPLPVADAYTLMDVLHDWSDEQVVQILSAIRRSAPAHARVLVIETMIIDSPEPRTGNLFDVIMLAVTGGRERSRSEFETLFATAGFRLERVIETGSSHSLVEASVA